MADNNKWFDCSECWVCEKWSKQEFNVSRMLQIPDKGFTEIILLTAFVKKRGLKRVQQQEEQKL